MKCPNCGNEITVEMISVYADGINLPARTVPYLRMSSMQPEGDIRPVFMDGRWFYDSMSLNEHMKKKESAVEPSHD